MRFRATRFRSLPALLLILLVASSLPGPRAVRAAGQPRLIEAGYIPPGFAQVEVEGRYAYMLGGPALSIADVADPDHPRLLSTIHLDMMLQDLAVSGPWVYLLGPNRELLSVDVANPEAPVAHAALVLPDDRGGASSLAVSDDLLVVAGPWGMWALDVATPTLPRLLSHVPYAGGGPAYVAMAGRYAYVLGGPIIEAMLYVFDLAAPARPQLLESWSFSGRVVSAGGIRAAAGRVAITVIDASSGYSFVQLGVIAAHNPARLAIQQPRSLGIALGSKSHVALSADAAFVTYQGGAPYIFDLHHYDDTPVSVAVPAWGMAAAGSWLYIAGPAGLQVVDVSDLAAPKLRGRLAGVGSVSDVMAVGPWLYLADAGMISATWCGDNLHQGGLAVARAPGAGPARVVEQMSFPDSGAGRVLLDGPTVYLSLTWQGCSKGWQSSSYIAGAIDVGQPDQPSLIGSQQLNDPWTEFVPDRSGMPRGITLHQGHLLIAYQRDGLFVLEGGGVTPAVLAVLRDERASGLFSAGELLYTVAPDRGLRAYRLEDDHSLTALGAYPGVKGVQVMVVGNYAYVAAGEDGLWILNVSDPAAIKLAGRLNTPGYANQLLVAGGRAYVADGPRGLQVIDISRPRAPALLTSYETIGSAQGVAVDGRYIYLADHTGGLLILAEVGAQIYLPELDR